MLNYYQVGNGDDFYAFLLQLRNGYFEVGQCFPVQMADRDSSALSFCNIDEFSELLMDGEDRPFIVEKYITTAVEEILILSRPGSHGIWCSP